MLDTFIRFLLAILGIGLCVVLAVWVAGIVGIAVPHQAVMILFAMAFLICILIGWRMFGGYFSGPWFPPPPPPRQ